MSSSPTSARRRLPRSLVLLAVGVLTAASAGVATSTASAATVLSPSGGDDTAAIQRALDSATPSNPIQLSAGVFQVSAPLAVRSAGTRLLGAGKGVTTLRSTRTAAAGDPLEQFNVFFVNNVEIGSLTIDGTSSGRVTDGIKAYYSSGDNFHDLAVTGTTTSGVTLAVTSNSTVTRSALTNIGANSSTAGGVYVWYSSTGNSITDNTIAGTASNGIGAAVGSSGTLIARNTISGVRGSGLDIELWHDCDSSVVEDNRLENWISAAVDDNMAIRRNTITRTGGAPGFAGIEYASASNTVIADNTINAPVLHGIVLPTDGEGPTDYTALLRNNVSGSPFAGVLLRGGRDGLRNLYMSGGSVTGTTNGQPGGGDALRIDTNARNLTFENVNLANNAADGIRVFGDYGSVDNVSVVNSRITGNQGDAVGPWYGYSNLVWSGNTVSGNGSNAVPAGAKPDVLRPLASVSVPVGATVGQPVTLGNASLARAGSVSRVLWDLGTGSPSTAWTPTVTYPRAGTYTVTLTVWDDAGRASSTTGQVVVG